MKNSRLTLILSSALLFVTVLACSGSQELLPPADRTLEYLQSLDEETLRSIDTDADSLKDYSEMYEHDTDPLDDDTDGDRLIDGDEVLIHGTNPLEADTDGDGLNDYEELNSYNTDPTKADTDGDGLSDGDEVNRYNTDPNDANGDADGDGVSDVDEINTHGTDPNNPDSDGDGFSDGQELEMGTNPMDGSDPVYIDMNAFNTVNFAFDRSDLSDEAAQKLADNVELLKNAPAFNVRVDAYTDHVGGDQYNLRLSLRRAKSVVDFYTNNGISADRIESRGLGKAPVACMDETEEQGCEENRRAESHPKSTLKYSPNK